MSAAGFAIQQAALAAATMVNNRPHQPWLCNWPLRNWVLRLQQLVQPPKLISCQQAKLPLQASVRCCFATSWRSLQTFWAIKSVCGCGTQVENQGKACRKELERALTRAAMDQDLRAIDEAEMVLSQKEHKLERLLTRKNMLEAALVRA